MHGSEETRQSDLPRLSPVEVRVYECATRVLRFSIAELAEAAELPDQVAEEAVRRLTELRLLRRSTDYPELLTAVSPENAREQLTRPVLRRISQLQAAADRLSEDLDQLVPAYSAGAAHQARREGVEVIPELSTVRHRLADLAAGVRTEVLTSQPGGARSEEVLTEAMDRTRKVLASGVRMRTLYQHTAQFSQTTVAYVEQVTSLGAEIRTLGDGFHQVIVLDREVAVIPLRGNPVGAALVRDPHMVDFVVAAFERAWSAALPFPSEHGRTQAIAASETIKADIIRLLLTGEDDKAVARRMGMSIRTCQRHITEIMNRLGARNRVHLGFLLSRQS
ncbi:helix-turn-helix transcriptional regulator [Streptacidiphilus sp. PAMC 29251]